MFAYLSMLQTCIYKYHLHWTPEQLKRNRQQKAFLLKAMQEIGHLAQSNIRKIIWCREKGLTKSVAEVGPYFSLDRFFTVSNANNLNEICKRNRWWGAFNSKLVVICWFPNDSSTIRSKNLNNSSDPLPHMHGQQPSIDKNCRFRRIHILNGDLM